ncbi:hypothetical protein HKBW3S06_00507 [Candidatus Hakubella thermalkaliphila]|uniref:Uncharacterized protein n=1 Tax=Candidatus Hakubella thermalkaliphila TaxID=2754717 RepID=A0A6V8NPS8_9ACTN|nr:hypothetical protein [Candidatus Hakubella thermalkaliphila]MBT9167446.1 hypothetical protein [Bacillota bacterium]GFP21281.1 hypothetical protein HKBW3S06_00507 [Candidatus Hakubella thermalkaliphila]GFP42112.1 hypothetical protein HKBW3C_01238 [Candidatus Hakubella thermalkaliphila]
MECVQKLKTIGYELKLEENHIICTWCGSGQPDPQMVEPLLAELKANKDEALRYIQEERARDPDVFLKSFKQSLAELNRRYQPGTLDFIESHYPDLYHKMEQTEDELDSLWREGDPGLFGESSKKWQELHEQAIQTYNQPEFCDLVTLLVCGQARHLPLPEIAPGETVVEAETFLRSYLRDLGHPALKHLARRQLLAFREALKKEEN